MDLREFQASLIYIVSFKIARAIQRDPGSKGQRAEERRRKGRERDLQTYLQSSPNGGIFSIEDPSS